MPRRTEHPPVKTMTQDGEGAPWAAVIWWEPSRCPPAVAAVSGGSRTEMNQEIAFLLPLPQTSSIKPKAHVSTQKVG